MAEAAYPFPQVVTAPAGDIAKVAEAMLHYMLPAPWYSWDLLAVVIALFS